MKELQRRLLDMDEHELRQFIYWFSQMVYEVETQENMLAAIRDWEQYRNS
ncbi:hypothetical protein L1999_20335 [Neobacillus drentensis]|nr:hypothetical protein [Neobacillus drentensis]ULT55433.1 hypothetical protein L1999_20335 [Neobacillus drentensis]